MEKPEHWQRMFLLPEQSMNELRRRVEHMKMYCLSTPETEQSYGRIVEILKGLKRE